jgi:hypothetical protein
MKTSTGLNVKAHYVRKKYEKGEKISDRQMEEVSIEKHEILSDWSYNLRPSKM